MEQRGRFGVGRLILSLALLIVGFLVGIIYSLAEFPTPVERRTMADDLSPVVLGRVIELEKRVEAQGAQVLAALHASRRWDRSAARESSETSSSTATTTPEGLPSGVKTSVPATNSPPASKLVPPSAPRLAEVESWKQDGDVRRKWLFSAENFVTEWFGAPDEVNADSGGEWWTYWKVADGKITRRYRFRMSAGRVIDFNTWEEAKPLALPAGVKR